MRLRSEEIKNVTDVKIISLFSNKKKIAVNYF